MKNYRIHIILILLALFNLDKIQAQDARSILLEAYSKQKEMNTFVANYKISYISDLDTGKTTVDSITISSNNGNIRIDNPSFISVSSSDSKLFIDHLNKEVTYIPKLYYSDTADYTIDYLNFYIPENSDQLTFSETKDSYEISISLKKNIKLIEYEISKKNNYIQSIKLIGQVHPVLLNNFNASLHVELLSLSEGKLKDLRPDDLLISHFIGKMKNDYKLNVYSTYTLHVLASPKTP